MSISGLREHVLFTVGLKRPYLFVSEPHCAGPFQPLDLCKVSLSKSIRWRAEVDTVCSNHQQSVNWRATGERVEDEEAEKWVQAMLSFNSKPESLRLRIGKLPCSRALLGTIYAQQQLCLRRYLPS